LTAVGVYEAADATRRELVTSRMAGNAPSVLPKIERTSVTESVYQALRDSVIAGRFAVGAQLVEARLANELGVSRGPVREALRRLRDEGLVADAKHRGLYVREFTVDDLVDIYNVRIGLEIVAIRLATRMRKPTAALRVHIDEMTDAASARDIARLTERELAFHQTLCDLSENRHIAMLFRSMSAQVQIAVALDNALSIANLRRYHDPLEVAREHEPVVEAIEQGDEAGAARILLDHIVSSVAGVLAASAPDNPSDARFRLLGFETWP
jgi:DNA-binding GntR family transcriptional regulator